MDYNSVKTSPTVMMLFVCLLLCVPKMYTKSELSGVVKIFGEGHQVVYISI